GHAGSYELLLESASGEHQLAHSEGLVSFLAKQKGLQLVFLNGCSSQQQAFDLRDAGVPAVVGTSQKINDDVATGLSLRFYKGLSQGSTIDRAWQEAVDQVKVEKGAGNFRDLFGDDSDDEKASDRFPWEIYFREGAEVVKDWNLPEAVENPLFGLPPIPKTHDLPETPFLFLKRYERQHAEIFFGRSYDIRNLFTRISDPQSPPILLLSGQSGVGKSSLLEAGLLPRMETDCQVIYTRRIQSKGLAGTLKYALEQQLVESHGAVSEAKKTPSTDDLLATWKMLEASGKPVIAILDQVEEFYTRPNADMKSEFYDFLLTLRTIFGSRSLRPQGKLILSYRKEYHLEIADGFKTFMLPRANVYLKPLQRKNILDIFRGLTQTPAFKQYYNLTVEENLPEIIADDLLEDRESPIAPVLQILLTKLWQVAKQESTDVPCFTIEQYQKLKKQGIAMGEFFEQQMQQLRRWQKEVVDSGLALDMLHFHTTALSTSGTRSLKELRETYQHRQDILDNLVGKCKELYLLTEAQHSADYTSLTHDTLAPVVNKEYNNSDKPGQRSARILNSKMADFGENGSNIWLDEADLAVVEQGNAGMRKLTEKEKQLLDVSRNRRRRNRILRLAAIATIVVFAAFAAWQWKKAEQQRGIALSKQTEAEMGQIGALSAASEALLASKQTFDDLDALVKSLQAGRKLQQVSNPPVELQAKVRGTLHKVVYGIKERNRLEVEGSVVSAGFSPDGSRLSVITKGGTVYIWDRSGKQLAKFKVSDDYVSDASFSPDLTKLVISSAVGSSLRVGSNPVTMSLWNLESQEPLVAFYKGHWGDFWSIDFSPDGRYIAAGGEKSLRLWDASGKPLPHFKKGQGRIIYVTFSPDSKKIVTVGDQEAQKDGDEEIKFWDLFGNQVGQLKGNTGDIRHVTFTPNSRQLLAGDRLWDWNGNKVRELSFKPSFVNPNGRLLAGSKDRIPCLWNWMGKQVTEFKGHQGWGRSLMFSPDGELLVTTGRDGTIRFWQVKSQKYLAEFREHRSTFKMIFSPDGSLLVSSDISYEYSSNSNFPRIGRDNAVSLWNMQGKKVGEVPRFSGNSGLISMILSPDNQQLAVVEAVNKTARLWDWKRRQIVGRLREPSGSRIIGVSFSGENSFPISKEKDGTVHVWDWEGKQINQFKDPRSQLYQVTLSNDGKRIITTGNEGARVWDLKGNQVAEFKVDLNKSSEAILSPDGCLLAVNGKESVTVWNQQGKQLSRIGETRAKNFSPDGRLLVSSYYGTVRLWDTKSGLPVAEYEENGVSDLQFSPDGKFLAIVGNDTDVPPRLWRIESFDELMARG
ncbi:MAG: AAA family ATPase, partial [bacterium]